MEDGQGHEMKKKKKESNFEENVCKQLMRDSLCCNQTAWQQKPATSLNTRGNTVCPETCSLQMTQLNTASARALPFLWKGVLNRDSSNELVAVIKTFKHLQRWIIHTMEKRKQLSRRQGAVRLWPNDAIDFIWCHRLQSPLQNRAGSKGSYQFWLFINLV